MKSERLKKLENELKDLDHWLNLDLVPKSDLEKHKLEIETTKIKIADEKKRLLFLKENGDLEDLTMPKKNQGKNLLEAQSIPDVNTNDMTQADTTVSDSFEPDHTTLFDVELGGQEKTTSDGEQEDDPFSEKNRWRRSLEISDPDSDDW